MSFGDEVTPAIHRAALDQQAADLWQYVEKLTREGFAVEFVPTARGTCVVRTRPVAVRVDRPATLQFANGECMERPVLRDAAGQLLGAVAGEIDADADARREKLEAEERDFRASLLDDTHPRFSGERDMRPSEAP